MNFQRLAAGLGLLAATAVVVQAQDAPARPADPIVAVIRIETEIDIRSPALVRRALGRARAAGAKHVVFELDTPGGRVDYLLEVVREIEVASAGGMRTAAYVVNWAKSAGALIALACDELYMAPTATIGSALPVGGGDALPDAEREKYVSAIRSTFRARAEVTGRPEVLAEAMVDPDVEVVEAEVEGQRRLLSRLELDRLQKTAQAHGRAHTIVELGVIKAKGKILDLTARQSVELGLITAIAETRSQVLAHLVGGPHTVIEFASTWSEDLAGWLTSPGIKALLFLVGLVALYVEFKAPGLSLPGLLGVCCFALFFFGHMVVGLAGAWEILLFIVGLGLIAVEIFLVPGFGVPGVAGIVCVLGSIVLAQVPFVWPSGEFASLQWALLLKAGGQTSLTLMASLVGMMATAVILPRTALGRRIILESPGVVAGQSGSAVASVEAWMGKQGIAETALRPAGRMRIGDTHLDVVSEGGFVEPGQPLQVVAMRGASLVVRPLPRIPGSA